jgi:hypothetical protein
MAHDAWLALENHFLRNRETRTLHIDATFQSFVQGDLSINDYCQKMKGFTDSLADLGIDIIDHVLVLNVLHGLNKNFEHLHAIDALFVVPEGARRSLPGRNPAGDSGAVDRCLHPHRPLRHAVASVVIFLRQWEGTPTRTVAAPITPLTTTVTTVRQEEEQP